MSLQPDRAGSKTCPVVNGARGWATDLSPRPPQLPRRIQWWSRRGFLY